MEQKHKRFIKQFKGVLINTPFVESLAKMLEYAKFLQDLHDTRQKLGKTTKVVLNEQCSAVIKDGIPTNMGDLGRLTIPFEFGNPT